jgi:hypothetical protein
MAQKMIKCRVFRGEKMDDNGAIKFFLDGKLDNGFDHVITPRDFEMEVKKWHHLLGYSTDAYDENGKLFWSNYREVEEKPDLDLLRKEYQELSGEEADKRWKENKLLSEIEKLKQN